VVNGKGCFWLRIQKVLLTFYETHCTGNKTELGHLARQSRRPGCAGSEAPRYRSAGLKPASQAGATPTPGGARARRHRVTGARVCNPRVKRGPRRRQGVRGLGGTALQERGFATRESSGGHADARGCAGSEAPRYRSAGLQPASQAGATPTPGGARARRHRVTGARVCNPRVKRGPRRRQGVRGLGGTAIQERGFETRESSGGTALPVARGYVDCTHSGVRFIDCTKNDQWGYRKIFHFYELLDYSDPG
jgi:hypothetical protein